MTRKAELRELSQYPGVRFRASLSDYIEQNTGIRIPVKPWGAGFYDIMADRLVKVDDCYENGCK